MAHDFEFLHTVSEGDPSVTSRSLDDRHWTVAFNLGRGPVRYYLYDRSGRQAHFLFTHRQALEGLPLAEMQPVILPSRDGGELVSYLTRPLSMAREGAPGRPVSSCFWSTVGRGIAMNGAITRFTPEVFACGVDIVGPSNLVTLLQTIPRPWPRFFQRPRLRSR